MADPQTANKFLYVPAHGADVDSWDVPVNANWNGLDQALGTYTTLNATGLSGTIALTTSQTIPLGFIITGTPVGSLVYQTPANQGGLWLVRNRATLGVSITLGFASASGGSTVDIPAGKNVPISTDGTSNGMNLIDTRAPAAGGSNGQVQVNVAGFLTGYAGFTFDGTTLDAPVIVSTAATQPPLSNNADLATTQYADNNLIQIVTTHTAATPTLTGTYSTTSGDAPTTSGGAPITQLATTFTPKNASSILEFDVVLKGVISANDNFMLALFFGTTLIDLNAQPMVTGAGGTTGFGLRTWLAPGSTSALNLTVRIGSTGGSSFFLNSANNGAVIPQVGAISWLTIKEILPHP